MSKIKLAATVILTRGPAHDPEVYLARRAPELRFFGGYWVFPGGNVSKADYHGEGEPEERVLKRCAIREMLEETDILCATWVSNSARNGTGIKGTNKGSAGQWRQFLAQSAAVLTGDAGFPDYHAVIRPHPFRHPVHARAGLGQ